MEIFKIYMPKDYQEAACRTPVMASSRQIWMKARTRP